MHREPLTSADFAEFFRDVQRWDTQKKQWVDRQVFDPFPWQSRLVATVTEPDGWPCLLDLPTGSGKTVAIDIAVFHLALEAERGAARRAAMRIAFVVDRRLIVDEAYDRARRLAEALRNAVDNDAAPLVVRKVALRLRCLAGQGRPPLVARSLRGGVPREDDWAETPCQPTVLCSTVDQVGSRLLFRGYGISDSMKPVQAGLLGSDALILLDEAHLSAPFRQTAQAIARHKSLRGPDEAPFHLALLTATPGEGDAERPPFSLGEDDYANAVLARRLEAQKPATLHDAGSSETARAEELAKQAEALLATLRAEGVTAPVIGVIANRVRRARAVFEKLTASLGDGTDLMLVIGRARSADRDAIAEQLALIKTSKPRPDKPYVVVATQTLEVGVDIDLDALVTDAASLDALRQRFGRVNRAGRSVPARGVIVADKVDRKPKRDGDPIYGLAIAATLDVLFPNGNETVDFGVLALKRILPAALKDGDGRSVLSDKADAPVLMPAYVDLWTHTAPIPTADPDPALFLHGPNREPAGVQIVWRADLDESLDARDTGQSERLRRLLTLVPPRAAEAIELPISVVRAWLCDEPGIDIADVAQRAEDDAPARKPKRAVFCWRGVDNEGSRIIMPGAVQPGDLIVVPSRYGGCDEYGWHGRELGPTADVYNKANEPYDGKRYVVRVERGLIRQAVYAEDKTPDKDGSEAWAREKRLAAEVDRILDAVQAVLDDPLASAEGIAEDLHDVVPPTIRRRLDALRTRAKKRLDSPVYAYRSDDGRRGGVMLVAPFGLQGDADEGGGGNGTEDDEAGSFNGRDQSLLVHTRAVEARVREFAQQSGLSPKLVDDLALAGWLHDAGKADPRFQRLLFNGDDLAMERDSVLAKSAHGRSSPAARERASLPKYWRHEALSVRLALGNARLQQAHDRALVLWLVGVHHGYGRPFFPHEDKKDGETRSLREVSGLSKAEIQAGFGPQSLGFVIEADVFALTDRDENDLRGLDWVTMFGDLKLRYGPWGLARLEAMLRLADHRASEMAREGTGDE